eukprot:2929006-Rhodomonas_salina.1
MGVRGGHGGKGRNEGMCDDGGWKVGVREREGGVKGEGMREGRRGEGSAGARRRGEEAEAGKRE